MTDATGFFVQQQLRRFADDCRSAQRQVERASTLREVRDWGSVHPGAVVASLRHMVPELRLLRAAQGRRAEQIVEQHLGALRELAGAGDADGWRKQVQQRQQHDWIFLRGDHAGLVLHLERELARMRRDVERAERPRGDGEGGA